MHARYYDNNKNPTTAHSANKYLSNTILTVRPEH